MNCSAPLIGLIDSPLQLLIVGLFALLIFGKRLPEVARSLGRSLTEFKKGLADASDETHKALTGEHTDMLPPPEKRVEPMNQQAQHSEPTHQNVA